MVALLLLSYRCIVTINVVWLFPTVPWVGLQCMIVVFPDRTHLIFLSYYLSGQIISLIACGHCGFMLVYKGLITRVLVSRGQ